MSRIIIRFVLLLSLVCVLLLAVFFLGDFSFPTRPPSLDRTYTPGIVPAPLEIGGYDVLGQFVPREQAEVMLQTEEGHLMLSRERGVIEITEELIDHGREVFYLETFGNELVITDIIGALDGPVNLVSVSRAIISLRGEHTTNLQIPVGEEFVLGGQTFPEGSTLDTGLDVPAGSLLPLGMRVRVVGGEIKVGMTCALCHSTVDPENGTIIEGATNVDFDIGLLLAASSNSAAFFRRTDIDPNSIPAGVHSYINEEGETVFLPDAQALEDAVDAAFLAWPPGVFDLPDDLIINTTSTPSVYTFGQFSYGWNGFAAIGWFQGLTTLNNNVHAVSADPTTDAASSQVLFNMDGEKYLGILLQNAAKPDFRLPEGVRPSEFIKTVDPDPDTPGIIDLIIMPDFPNGSAFTPNGVLAGSPGLPVAEELNALSAFQNTLAPPPNQPTDDLQDLQRGAQVFVEAGCAECHSGRHFSNNQVIPLSEIGTQPSRAMGLVELPELYVAPRTYPPSITAPPYPAVGALPVPMTEQQQQNLELAYAVNGEGGYKVPTLIGIYLHAPHLHDNSVAAGPNALQEEGGRYVITDPEELGTTGTLMRGILPDPEASLRVLVDSELRAAVIEANRTHPDLQRSHVEGIGHEFWVDEGAGFSLQDQTDLILFLLSLDDDPAVLPENQE